MRRRRSTSPSHAHRSRSSSSTTGPRWSRRTSWTSSRCSSRHPAARFGRARSLTLRDADVVVLVSATPLTVGTSRLEYLGKNAAIADEFADALAGRLRRGDRGRQQPRRSARDPTAAADGPRSAEDPRLHPQRQPAPENRARAGPRRAARERGGVGRRRARRRERPALRPGHRGRPPGAADDGAGSGGRGVSPHLVRAPRRARLGAIVDLDVRTRRVAHGRRRSAAPASSGPPRSCSTASTASTASR